MTRTSFHGVSPAVQRAILHLSFATFSSMTIQRLCDPMLPALAKDFQASMGQVAAVISWFAVIYGAAQIFYGPLGDRFGKMRVISLATLGCSLGCLGSALATSLNELVMARMLAAACAAAIIPMAMAWVGDVVAYEVRQETLARLGLGSTLGMVGGQIIGGLFTDTIGWRWAFGGMALLFMAVGTLLLSRQQKHDRMPNSEGTPTQQAFHRKVIRVLQEKRPRLVLTTAMLEGAFAFGVVAMAASHLHHRHDLSLTLSGGIVALFGLGGVGYMLSARFFIRRLGESAMLRLGSALFASAFAVMAFSPWWLLTLPASLLAGLGFFMFHNTLQVLATQMFPPERGTCMALFAGLLFTGQSVGVLLAAMLLAWIGSAWVLALGGLMLAVLGQSLPIFLRRC
jgi:YNFM family putative membrane transporter